MGNQVSYDNPMHISYSFGLHDFAATALAAAIAVPKGVSRCRIEEIHVSVTEIFNADTTAAFVRIGTSADPDKFAELDMQLAALTDGYGIDDAPAADTPLKDIGHGGFGVVDIATEDITQLEIVTVKNTGGTPTGIGYLTVVIAWW